MYKRLAYPAFEQMLFNAAANGAQLVDDSWRWVLSGDCTDPFTTVYATDSKTDWRESQSTLVRRFVLGDDRVIPVGDKIDRGSTFGLVHKGYRIKPERHHLEILTRCRDCENCRAQRRGLWFHRAKAEVSGNYRTWFGTLTYRPEEAMRRGFSRDLELSSFAKLDHLVGAPSGKVAKDLRDPQKAIVRHSGPDITKFLKRVRKNAGRKIRYLIVPELHKSGVPHFHFLLHESEPGQYLTYRVIQAAWSHGFSQAKLVDGSTHAASYVAKYLSKEMYGRVRASQRYGSFSKLHIQT